MAPKIGHRELLSLHQDRLDYYQSNINELTTNMLRNPLRSHLEMSGFDIKNARRIQTSNSLQVGTSINVGNSITINQNIALGGDITDLSGNILTFGGGSNHADQGYIKDSDIAGTGIITTDGSGVYNVVEQPSAPGFLFNYGPPSNNMDFYLPNIRDLDDVLVDSNDVDVGVGGNSILYWDQDYGKWRTSLVLNEIYAWGDHSLAGYLTDTDITNVLVDQDFTQAGIMITGGSGGYGVIPNNGAGFLKNDGSGGFTYENIVSGGGGGSPDLTVNGRGQTFSQLLTEQPNKFNQDGEPNCNSSKIIINWNYTDIIPTDENIRKFAQGETIKSRCLPYINEIKIQIKGSVSGTHSISNDTWLDYVTLSIPDTEDYNDTNELKTITFNKTDPANADNSDLLNILSKTDPFFVRIFGRNDNSNDLPTVDTRALEINRPDASGVAFLEAAAPSKPLFQRNENKFSNNNSYYLTSVFKVEQTESGVSNSGARLNNYITSFSEDDDSDGSLRSEYFSLNPQSNTTSGILAGVQSNTDFEIKIGDNNLRAGTKYNYTVTVTNNISTASSAVSDSQLSPYTRLPTSSSNGTTLTLTEATQETSVTSSTFTNQNVIYLNSNISDKTQFNVSNTSNQTFEITKPYTSNQETTTEGFGRFVDNVSELVSISLKIDDISIETITFNGFNQTSGIVGTPSQSGTTYFDNATIQDMYSDDNNKGFRLIGTVSLKHINDIYNNIGEARSNAYTLQYDYQRNSIVNAATTGPLYNVYIDNLSELPNLDVIGTDSIIVNSVEYCMGIPSVENFTVNLQRKYSNINSIYKFIPGNKVIGKVQSIDDVYWQSINFISDPIENGEYTKNYSSSNHYYTVSKNFPISAGNGDNLNITEHVYSLVGTTNVTNAISVNHYFDKSSFTGTTTLTPKVDLTDVYEITDSTELEKLGGNNEGLGGVGITNYLDHNVLVKDHTLLYINGGFKTNASYNYPNVNDYTWNNQISGNNYNSGASAFNISGEQDDTNGYKWIVFRISKTSSYFKTAAKIGGGPGIPYIDIPELLIDKGLGGINSIISTGYGSQNAIGFVRIFATRYNESDGYQIARFTSNRNPSSTLIWYAGQNSASISLNTLLDESGGFNYGGKVDTVNYNVNNIWGIECPSQANIKRDDIDIFIGLKNSIPLPS
tara:strand:+ start:7976 stop:11467 length:3492 start_codon:yes stop_codon:yes gene_type:complete